MKHRVFNCLGNGHKIRIEDGRADGAVDGVEIHLQAEGSDGFLVIGLDDLQRAFDKAGVSLLATPTGTHARHGQGEPYTEDQIEAMPCFRCGNPARFQWSICADSNVQRPICADCDILLNHHVLQWSGDPDAMAKLTAYAHFVHGTQPPTPTGE